MYSYTPNFIPKHVIIYGCGGTGSRLVPLIAQFITSCKWVLDPKITLIDGDVVEQKNLSRQNFIEDDVGQNKAVVLANRYSGAYGINIEAIPEFFSNETVIPGFTSGRDILHILGSDILHILCVDSVDSRKVIHHRILNGYKVYSAPKSILLIDTGNGNDFGQVKFMNGASVNSLEWDGDMGPEEVDKCPLPLKIPGIPYDLDYFENMVEMEGDSCAELDQTMAINVLVASTVLGVVQNFYYCKPISYNRLNISLHSGIQAVSIKSKDIEDSYDRYVNRSRFYPLSKSGYQYLSKFRVTSTTLQRDWEALTENGPAMI